MASGLAEHEERSIRDYVVGQLHDEEDEVLTVERVSRHRVAGQEHEIFDVRTKKGRWWVITGLTNLYDQARFRTADETLSFHVGLMLRLMERDRVETEDDRRREAEGAWRRYTDAVDAMNEADDVEDFQAIGVRLREALLALVREHTNASWLGEVQDPPRRDDFKGWMERFALRLCPGRRERAYLNTVAGKTWDLVVNLQHDAEAGPLDVELALDAVNNLLGAFMITKVRYDRGQPERCPRCGSYRYGTGYEMAEHNGAEGMWEWKACAACDHRSERTFSPWSA
jgi:hypothetical protein